VEERVVLTSFFQEARLTTLGGAKAAAFFPYSLLRLATRAMGRRGEQPGRPAPPPGGNRDGQ